MTRTATPVRRGGSPDPYDPREVLARIPARTQPVIVRAQWALSAAQLAPSIHNTQPWLWTATPDADGRRVTLQLRADPARAVPIVDPDGRQTEISCGAAIGAYLIGSLAAGLIVDLNLAPPTLPGVLAQLSVTDDRSPVHDSTLGELAALRSRRSERGWFHSNPVPTPWIRRAVSAAATRDVLLHPLDDSSDRDAVDRLTALATLSQVEGERVTEEIRRWTREPGDPRRDGVPARAWRRTSNETVSGPLVLRDFAQERPTPDVPEHIGVEPLPALLLLATDNDDLTARLRTGMALVDVLITLESLGVAAGMVNQATELPAYRRRLATELDLDGWPQLLLRAGYRSTPVAAPTARRPAHDANFASRAALSPAE